MRAPTRQRSSAYAQRASPCVSLPFSSVFLNRPAVRRTPHRQVASRCDRLAIGGLPSPGAGAVAAPRHALLVDLGDDVAIAGEQRLGRAHLGAERQLAFGEAVGAVLLVFRLRAVGLGAPGAEGAFVHLAAGTEVADLRILRRAERAGVETVAAADAQVLAVQHDRVGRGVEAIDRAHRRAGRVCAVHAGHRHRALARLAVIERDHAAAVDAPRDLVLVLAGGDAGVALDAAVRVAEELHSGHGAASLSRADLAERDLRLLHTRRRVVAVGGDGIGAFAEHHGIGAGGIVGAQVLAAEPAAEVERHPGHALADALGDQRLDLGLRGVLRARHPDPGAVLDVAFVCVGRVDLDEHLLLQFGEPLVRPRLLAAALVFDETAGRQDDRELLGDALLDRGLLHREADVRQPELLGVGQRRIFLHQLDARRVDRLAMHRDRVRQAEGVHARLAVAVGDTAVHEGHALNTTREIDRPRHRVRRRRIDLVDHGQLFRRQVAVPAELLQDAERELGIAVLDLAIFRVGPFGEQVDLARRAVRQLLLAFDAEAGAEHAAAVHDREIGVVEERRPRMLDLRRTPAGPRQAVI